MKWRLMVSNDEHEKLIAQLEASKEKNEKLKRKITRYSKEIKRLSPFGYDKPLQ